MPIYTIRNKDTGDVKDMTLSLAEREELLSDSNFEQLVGKPPSIGDSVRLGFRTHDNEFNDLLKTVKKNHRGSTIQTR